MSEPAPPLSVVVGTTQPWPEAELVLDSLYGQARRLGAEVVLAVNGASGRPPAGRYPDLTIVEAPGASVFELRARAVAASHGDVVAMTEDHCRVAPDWCERVIASHAARPEADVIDGAVRNGADDPVGWAAFLISNGPFLPPLATRERAIVTGHANVTFKRRALEGAGDIDDGRCRVALRGAGGRLFTDGAIEVLHVQTFPLPAMCAYIFHGGRTLAGSQRALLSPGQWVRRLAKVLLLPVRVAVNTPRLPWRAARRSRAYWTAAARCPGALALLLAFYYSGELTGHLFGPGDSPLRLR